MEPDEPTGRDGAGPSASDEQGQGQVRGSSNLWASGPDETQAPSNRTGAAIWVAALSCVLAVLAVVALIVVVVQLSSSRSDLDDSERAVKSLESELRDASFERATAEAQRDAAEEELESRDAEADAAEDHLSELEVSVSDLFVESYAWAFPASRDVFRCAADILGPQAAVDVLTLGFVPEAFGYEGVRLLARFEDAYVGCGGDPTDLLQDLDDLLQNLEGLLGDGDFDFDADGPGDDPILDDHYEACSEGDMVACDELYWNSPFGSEYERFGRTCGGRTEELDFDEFCVDTQVSA